MITITLNDQTLTVAANTSLQQLLENRQLLCDYSAVAINRQFIGRDDYRLRQLQAGDIIDVVKPMQGG
ncbi:MAG: sulfur carrier protein ThiS [Gammaproteobacteria bacterium]|nr:sulfur carrier protein ThiS [Gammaproteobacteria bacterium]MCP4473653.1 sulfur carrier protein ThiS [Gammaproteobacteria bacterium]